MGGLIYNTSRGVHYVKSKTSPTQPQTSRQLNVRGILTTVSRAWQSLTDSQRTNWSNWSDTKPESDWTGTALKKTGFNMFCRLNTRLVDEAIAQITEPPAVAAPASPAGLALTPSAGQISIAFTAYAGTATMLEVWREGPMSAGRKGKLARAKLVDRVPGETTPYAMTGLAAGKYAVWVRGFSEADGQVSGWATAEAVVPS